MVDKTVAQKSMKIKITMVPIDELVPSSVQPRTVFDDEKIAELAQSIAVHGILQPLIVRRGEEHPYEIVAGERRFRAARLARLKNLPCIVMDMVTEEALAVALVENIQREDLNAIEEATAYLKLKQALRLSQEQIALRVGKDRASIANIMRLLRLPLLVQEMVVNDALSMGHARALLAIESQDMIAMVAKKIVREGLSVRRTEKLVRSLKLGYERGRPVEEENRVIPLEKEIRQKLEQIFGTRVEVKREGAGFSLVIHFAGVEQLNGMLETLGVEI